MSVAAINGQTIRPSSPGAETTTQLGGGSYATINEQAQDATSLTQRLVFMHIAGVGDYVLGEAQVTRPAGNPCAAAAGGVGSGSGSRSGGSGSGFGGAGNDRVRSAWTIEYVNGGKGKDVAYVTAREMKYAHRHGCEKVRRIRAKH